MAAVHGTEGRVWHLPVVFTSNRNSQDAIDEASGEMAARVCVGLYFLMHVTEGISLRQRQAEEKKQAIRIGRRGRLTKIHAVVDNNAHPLNFSATGGQARHSEVVEEVVKYTAVRRWR
jgi:hypothetical protein